MYEDRMEVRPVDRGMDARTEAQMPMIPIAEKLAGLHDKMKETMNQLESIRVNMFGGEIEADTDVPIRCMCDAIDRINEIAEVCRQCASFIRDRL